MPVRPDLDTLERKVETLMRDVALAEQDLHGFAVRFEDAHARAIAAEAQVETLREALRLNVGDAYGLFTQGESPTQRRQPAAQRIYDRSKATLEGERDDPVCICTRFSDLPEGTIIADLTCPIHGVNGTSPGDVLPDTYSAEGASDE